MWFFVWLPCFQILLLFLFFFKWQSVCACECTFYVCTVCVFVFECEWVWVCVYICLQRLCMCVCAYIDYFRDCVSWVCECLYLYVYVWTFYGTLCKDMCPGWMSQSLTECDVCCYVNYWVTCHAYDFKEWQLNKLFPHTIWTKYVFYVRCKIYTWASGCIICTQESLLISSVSHCYVKHQHDTPTKCAVLLKTITNTSA